MRVCLSFRDRFVICFLFCDQKVISKSLTKHLILNMTFKKNLTTIESQFLCCYPVNNIGWKKIITNLTWEEQKLLLDRTYNHQLNRQYPVNVNYQINFLKQLIHHLEQSTEEVHDEIYEAYCQLQSAGKDNEKFFYKHYSLPQFDTVVTLKESKGFVADGTTGLCSWQASLALSDWLLRNPDVVCGKSIIELGSGTGLCGFIVSKCCKPAKIVLTDGSPAVINALELNKIINFPDSDGVTDKLSIMHLPWEEHELVKTRNIDVILAADVVYDSTEFSSLMNIIDHIFQLMEDHVQLVLAATVRNKETLQKFLRMLDEKEFKATDKETVESEKSCLFWDRSTPVRIMMITRNKVLS